jgi:hypothetical protein
MRILVRTSQWAIWARRLGSFAVPLVLVPILMHRAGAIDTTSFGAVEALAILVAALAILGGLGALARIWFTGDLGWGLALVGLVLGLLCLGPAAYLGYNWLELPIANDVTTDPQDPLPLVSAGIPDFPRADDPAGLAAAFPGVRDRTYPVGSRRVFDIADQLVAERGWEPLLRHVPVVGDPDGQINAVAATLFGFRDEVAIRLAAQPDGSTRVSMRSISLTAFHEPGANGRRIEDFLAALDDRITQLQKDQPAGSLDDESDNAPPIPAPAPPRGKRR